MKKTRSKKSHDTVPLRVHDIATQFQTGVQPKVLIGGRHSLAGGKGMSRRLSWQGLLSCELVDGADAGIEHWQSATKELFTYRADPCLQCILSAMTYGIWYSVHLLYW
jgi:hypothetical protein